MSDGVIVGCFSALAIIVVIAIPYCQPLFDFFLGLDIPGKTGKFKG